MRDVVLVYDWAGAADVVADVLSQFCDVDAVAGGAGGEALRGGTVDVGVFVEAEAEDGIGDGRRNANCRVGGLLEVNGSVQSMELGFAQTLHGNGFP